MTTKADLIRRLKIYDDHKERLKNGSGNIELVMLMEENLLMDAGEMYLEKLRKEIK